MKHECGREGWLHVSDRGVPELLYWPIGVCERAIGSAFSVI